MQLSDNFLSWQKLKPFSYITPNLGMKKLLKFDMGEITTMKRTIPYPDPTQSILKQMIATSLSITSDMVSFGCGSDELIEVIPRIFLNPGDKALVITPTFFRFIDTTLRVGARIVTVNAKKGEQFAINTSIINEVIQTVRNEKIKLVWISNPVNPTGIRIQHKLLLHLINSCKAIIVIDEVFQNLHSPLNFNKQFLQKNKHVIILRSSSKVDGLAGLRLGAAIADPSLISLFEQWRLPFNLPITTQQIIRERLKRFLKVRATKKTLEKERSWLFSKIKTMKNLEIGAPSITNIFLLRHKSKNIFIELLKDRIKAADFRNAPGIEGLGFVRLTIKSHRENLALVNALHKINTNMLY